VAGIVESVVFKFCKGQGFAYSSRLKTQESLAEKVDTGRYAKWSDLDDLFGCIIVIPTLNEEPDVLEFLRTAFATRIVRTRGAVKKPPEQFRFDATRFIASLKPKGADSGNEPIYRIMFEIQVRTAFEHAWSATTHALVYKTQTIDWKRSRLAAPLKASVEQLDLLIVGFDEAAGHISPSEWPELAARADIVHLFSRALDQGWLPTECAPKDWSRFSENVLAMLRSSARPRGTRLEDLVPAAVSALDKAIQTQAGALFPRSVSLCQFVLGNLVQAGVLPTKFYGYTPPVTLELRQLYPRVTEITPVFDFEIQ